MTQLSSFIFGFVIQEQFIVQMTQSVITGNFWEGESKSIYIIFGGHFELISLPNRLVSTLFSATGPCHLKLLWGERLEYTTFFKIPAETAR